MRVRAPRGVALGPAHHRHTQTLCEGSGGPALVGRLLVWRMATAYTSIYAMYDASIHDHRARVQCLQAEALAAASSGQLPKEHLARIRAVVSDGRALFYLPCRSAHRCTHAM